MTGKSILQISFCGRIANNCSKYAVIVVKFYPSTIHYKYSLSLFIDDIWVKQINAYCVQVLDYIFLCSAASQHVQFLEFTSVACEGTSFFVKRKLACKSSAAIISCPGWAVEILVFTFTGHVTC